MAFIETNLRAALGTPSTGTGLRGLFLRLISVIQNEQSAQKLSAMPAYLLRDIGFSEGDIQVLRDQAALDRRDALNAGYSPR
jgi:uncharacterized protein YjiS (DUF1127 family)